MQRTKTLLRMFVVVAVFGSRHACPTAFGAGTGARIHRHWGTSLPRPSDCHATARGRVSGAGDRHATSSGVRVFTRVGEGPVWAPASPLATSSPPQAPLVTRENSDAALPCSLDKEGRCIAAALPHGATTLHSRSILPRISRGQ
jgi:hypothetical protein